METNPIGTPISCVNPPVFRTRAHNKTYDSKGRPMIYFENLKWASGQQLKVYFKPNKLVTDLNKVFSIA